jgi:hydrogenase expression/formation protein HypE
VRRRRAVVRDELVTLAHGAGGKATRDLVEALFVEAFANEALEPLSDSATTTALLCTARSSARVDSIRIF